MIVEGIKCGRHCERVARFSPLEESVTRDELTGAYVDPDNYASRVVYFSISPSLEWYRNFLKEQLGDRLKDKDLRPATRHGWELGSDGEREAKILLADKDLQGITEYYWTFYPRSEEEKKEGTYLCSKQVGGCGRRLFVKKTSEQKLCNACEVLAP